MESEMVVPPHDPCIACMKGDTTTGFGIRGEFPFLVRVLSELLSLEEMYASKMVTDLFGGEFPAPGRQEIVVRCCEECAETAGFPAVVRLTQDATLPTLQQDDA